MGSLFGILDKRLETIKNAQADLPTATIKSPGGILGHEISARISLQVHLLTIRYIYTTIPLLGGISIAVFAQERDSVS